MGIYIYTAVQLKCKLQYTGTRSTGAWPRVSLCYLNTVLTLSSSRWIFVAEPKDLGRVLKMLSFQFYFTFQNCEILNMRESGNVCINVYPRLHINMDHFPAVLFRWRRRFVSTCVPKLPSVPLSVLPVCNYCTSTKCTSRFMPGVLKEAASRVYW